MNPQSTDARVVSRDSCEDRSSEAACTHQLLGRHACTQCHDVMTVTTSHSNPRRALDGGRRRHLSVHRLRNSDYNECERQVVDGERRGGEGGNQRIERRERQETRDKVEKVFQLASYIRRVTSSTSPSSEPSLRVVRHGSCVRSTCRLTLVHSVLAALICSDHSPRHTGAMRSISLRYGLE